MKKRPGGGRVTASATRTVCSGGRLVDDREDLEVPKRWAEHAHHGGELRHQAIGVVSDAKMTTNGKRPREGGRPRAAHAYERRLHTKERINSFIRYSRYRFLLLCPFCRPV